jgi:hypothetical protein
MEIKKAYMKRVEMHIFKLQGPFIGISLSFPPFLSNGSANDSIPAQQTVSHMKADIFS